MPAAPDDWRRRCQEIDLPPGTTFERRALWVRDPKWDHEHCEFCWAKFMDLALSDAARAFIEADPTILTEGYVVTEDAHSWVCPTCWDDFADEFGWRLVGPAAKD